MHDKHLEISLKVVCQLFCTKKMQASEGLHVGHKARVRG
jgi:hypothetical protein